MAEIKMSLSPFMGLDLYSYPNLMKDGYSPDCFNVETDAGILRSCKGFRKINNVFGCRHYFNHYKSDGKLVKLVFRNGNIENMETGTVLKSGYYTDTDTLSMVNYQMNNTYITVICNGRNAPVKFNGSTVTALGGGPPVAAFTELHNERVFMAGSAANPDRVYYSASFAPESWNVDIESGYIDLPSWDGGRIREIKSLFGDLVVFKDFGLYRIYGTYPGEFGVEKINSNVGCINKHTIAFNGETCFFLNHLGLCAYNGMSAKLIEDKRLKAVFDKVNFKRINEARIYDYSGKLYMFLPMEEDCVIEYDYTSGVILRKKGFKVKQFFSDSDGMYIIDGDGYVCKYNSGGFFGDSGISCYWKSRDYDISGKGEVKNVMYLCMTARGSGRVRVCINTDKASFSSSVLLSHKYTYYKIPIRARGRKFTVEISSDNGSSFELDSPDLYMDVEEE